MRIKKYFDNYYKNVIINNNHNVKDIVENSKMASLDSVFVAIKGYKHNGIDYIEEAIKNGAKTIIFDEEISFSNKNVNFIKVCDAKVELARLLNWFYQKKSKPKIIAVTGTNGKTSVTMYTFNALKKLNINCLLIGTEENISFYNGRLRYIRASNTTPSITMIYQLMMEHPYKYLIMEASSQGICEGRLLGLTFRVACFTNITQDHLDYHKTMDNYANAKSRIVYQLEDEGILILNRDMNYFTEIKKLSINRIYTYSIQDDTAMIYGRIIDRKIGGMKVAIDTLSKKKIINTKLMGDFNLENLLATYTILHSLNLEDALIVDLLENISAVKGRMNLFLLNKAYIVVDFAHTPDGIKQVLEYFDKIKRKKIITIIGCGGHRDISKRPIMANVATTYSDLVIFTEDNSRDEDVNKIISDMEKGAINNKYLIEPDRKKALDLAIEMAESEDIICILGKGSETEIISKEIKKFSDIDYIRNLGGKRLNG